MQRCSIGGAAEHNRGLDEDTIELQLAKMRGESETASRKRLRLMFIMSKLSKHFEINITEDEVNARISEIAASRGARPDAVRAELAKTGQIREISMSIQHSKSADRIVDTAKVTEMPAEDWNKLVDAKAAAKS